ncbi:hypothetical protein AWC38_SpisGene23499 [Stylophora pistillata]|uniref:Uncharacterized protein n=1 Tax=Stylophora pistillata TaxID=50429 RepID=A0A2B4R5U7_STYPI|nr:hypothetical protein AWC38_SpisGene23499 [Stylophora pistillata]
MSRLANNAELYWKKKTAAKSPYFHSTRTGTDYFEHFLRIYAQGRERKDEEIMEGSQTLLESFPQKCMYLEKCLHPKNYAQILDQLLDTFDSTIQPMQVVELLCLLGHECRKKDQKIYARLLSDKKDPRENKRKEKETQLVLDVSSASLGDLHPERAATLLLSGTLAKRDKQRDTATGQLTRCLGKHFMTAEALKALADLRFFLGGGTEEEDNLKICVAYFNAAIEMFYHLVEDGSKESILTLKNCATCNQKRGNFDESMNLFTKAEQVAERELKENHDWKVSIKTTWAILHDEMEKTDKAKEMMLEGLLIAKKLNLSIEKMGN